MDLSPLVSESQPRRKRLGWDWETRDEKNPSHMENHTTCISISMNASGYSDMRLAPQLIPDKLIMNVIY